ncbi:MAG: murein L,D-transpeptidase catalytic domain family protein [Bacteroidetes bacterium]|nr:murein L,D-transpeptidase catalytic domain family protein [Bacteroidota bacterium]
MNKLLTLLFVSVFLLSFYWLGEKSISSKANSKSKIHQLYTDCGLENILSFDAFSRSYEGYEKYKPEKPLLAVCDFSKPSNQKRFFVIDLEQKKLLYQSLVAHGKNSGELMANHFSNEPSSLQSSLGFFSVGAIINSPKHGTAVLLNGLEKNLNDNARTREIIIHGADYVCEKFVQQHGRLGRSFGCPALPADLIEEVAPVLANGSLLYIYAK